MGEGNLRDEGRFFVGKWEGGDICDGRSGAGIVVGEEVAEGTQRKRKQNCKLYSFSVYIA